MKRIFNPTITFIFPLFFFLSLQYCFSQEDQIEIVQAEVLAGTVINGKEVRILRNNVIIKHKEALLYCDSAYQYVKEKTVDAFGNTRLMGEDGGVITSNKMFYDGNTRIARAISNVVLTDEGKVLTTEELDYDIAGKIAYYTVGGKIIDADNTLTSQTGSYDMNSKVYYFTNNVLLINTKDGDKIETNDLRYSSTTKMAYFQGPTKITTTDKAVLYANQGEYNTETKISNFRGRPKVEDDKYILLGDSLFYDDYNKEGIAIGNTEIIAKLDSVIINGDVGTFSNKTGISVVYGNAVMRQISGKDTLFLSADTLVSINNTKTNTKVIYAYHQARIFRKDLQAVCDSLVYNRVDSTIHFYKNPVIWSIKNQMTADSIHMEIANSKIRRMYLRINSYIVSVDTLGNYNQLKGKYITSFFTDNQIRRMNVNGNGESIYFTLEEGDSTMMGMNRAECTDMVFTFLENNKLETINYINKADAIFVPPHELEEPQKKLKGFIWRAEEKPTKKQMLDRLLKRREDKITKIENSN